MRRAIYMYIYIYTYIYSYIYIYICICIYRERDRERDPCIYIWLRPPQSPARVCMVYDIIMIIIIIIIIRIIVIAVSLLTHYYYYCYYYWWARVPSAFWHRRLVLRRVRRAGSLWMCSDHLWQSCSFVLPNINIDIGACASPLACYLTPALASVWGK